MKNTYKKLLTLNISTIALPLILVSCGNSSKSKDKKPESSNNNLNNLIMEYKNEIKNVKNNFFANKIDNNYESNNDFKEKIIDLFLGKNNNEQLDKLMKNFYDESKNDAEFLNIIRNTFFDYSDEFIIKNLFESLSTIIKDFNKQFQNNLNQFLNYFTNKEFDDNSKIIFKAFDDNLKGVLFKSEEWANWIESDYSNLSILFIDSNKNKLVDKDEFINAKFKNYNSNNYNSASIDHNHSHATYNMLWETLNYLTLFNNFKNNSKLNSHQNVNFVKNVENIKAKLKEKNNNELLAKFEELVSRINNLFKFTESNFLSPLYQKSSEAYKKLYAVRKVLIQIAQEAKLTRDQIKKIFNN
ncbi:hypothetical protein JS510_01125 [Mycoplasma tauri]|uniref:MAG5150 family histidine triad lipoprotein n=1 Tax=Mycoplasma tauri TaxID=547987 RepID=UPI0019673C16|nr:hypothetical protein [Mycoplasma tauri]QSB07708.1 hypothetical protein JS510_01125 [Mycoplasma tauri]